MDYQGSNSAQPRNLSYNYDRYGDNGGFAYPLYDFARSIKVLKQKCRRWTVEYSCS